MWIWLQNWGQPRGEHLFDGEGPLAEELGARLQNDRLGDQHLALRLLELSLGLDDVGPGWARQQRRRRLLPFTGSRAALHIVALDVTDRCRRDAELLGDRGMRVLLSDCVPDPYVA